MQLSSVGWNPRQCLKPRKFKVATVDWMPFLPCSISQVAVLSSNVAPPRNIMACAYYLFFSETLCDKYFLTQPMTEGENINYSLYQEGCYKQTQTCCWLSSVKFANCFISYSVGIFFRIINSIFCLEINGFHFARCTLP